MLETEPAPPYDEEFEEKEEEPYGIVGSNAAGNKIISLRVQKEKYDADSSLLRPASPSAETKQHHFLVNSN